jgi:RNA polymerase sigma-70 factor (ECF subfamily)
LQVEGQDGMTDSSRDLLRRIFLLGYEDLKVRLTRRLGSVELAGDALQEAWLRLENAVQIGPVLRPQPYILRMAYNIALKRLQGERETVTLEEVREELNLVDDAPSPAQVAEARAELTLLLQAAKELTPRRRDILFAARVDGASIEDIGRRFAISERVVARELKAAVLHCAERIDRKFVQTRGRRLEGDPAQNMPASPKRNKE